MLKKHLRKQVIIIVEDMLSMGVVFRLIEPQDNKPLQALFKEILLELECFESEYLSNPDELHDLYQDYQAENSRYYVITDEETGDVLGGGGYASLAGETSEHGTVCEIQKMYLSSQLRGQGIGKKLLSQLIEEAKQLDFDLFYIETMTNMTGAVSLYEKFGFKRISNRLGGTGHNCCSIFMTRPIT